MLLFVEECDGCLACEERVFTDSWTGKSFCLSCLGEIVNDITNSPATEGDNLQRLMAEHDMFYEEDEDDEDD